MLKGQCHNSFYVLNIYKFSLKEFQDNLYTMDNLEIMGDDNGFGRNSYSSCIYVCMCACEVVRYLLWLRNSFTAIFWIDIYAQTKQQVWGLFCSLPHKKELCYILFAMASMNYLCVIFSFYFVWTKDSVSFIIIFNVSTWNL